MKLSLTGTCWPLVVIFALDLGPHVFHQALLLYIGVSLIVASLSSPLFSRTVNIELGMPAFRVDFDLKPLVTLPPRLTYLNNARMPCSA